MNINSCDKQLAQLKESAPSQTKATHYQLANHKFTRKLVKKQSKDQKLGKTKKKLAPALIKIPPGLTPSRLMARSLSGGSTMMAVKKI